MRLMVDSSWLMAHGKSYIVYSISYIEITKKYKAFIWSVLF